MFRKKKILSFLLSLENCCIHFSHSFSIVTFAHQKNTWLFIIWIFERFYMQVWYHLAMEIWASIWQQTKTQNLYSYLLEVEYNRWGWLARFIRAKKKKNSTSDQSVTIVWCRHFTMQEYLNRCQKHFDTDFFFSFPSFIPFLFCLWFCRVTKKLTIISVETKSPILTG